MVRRVLIVDLLMADGAVVWAAAKVDPWLGVVAMGLAIFVSASCIFGFIAACAVAASDSFDWREEALRDEDWSSLLVPAAGGDGDGSAHRSK